MGCSPGDSATPNDSSTQVVGWSGGNEPGFLSRYDSSSSKSFSLPLKSRGRFTMMPRLRVRLDAYNSP
jgi:hypothetical protein